MPTSSRYKVGRPLQEVRLRKWKPARVAQFKKVIELLETQLNKTMATQVEQGERRVISNKVPTVVNIKVRSGYKNFQLTFDAAKGIKDLLFYEIQKDTSATFNDPTTFNIPQTGLTVVAPFENQEMNFRVRCINSKFEAGPWSKTGTTTSRTFFRIAAFHVGQMAAKAEEVYGNFQLNAGEGVSTITDIAVANWDTWTDVGGITYSPSKGHMCVQVVAGAQVSCINHFSVGSTGNFKRFVNDISVKFRIKRAGVLMSDGEMNIHAWGFQKRETFGSVQFARYEAQVFSAMMTEFEAYDGSGPIVSYRVEAKVLKESHSSLVTGASPAENIGVDVITTRTFDDYVRINVANVSILEVLELE